jgi:hypothetical protein
MLSHQHPEDTPNIQVIKLAFHQALALVKFKTNFVSPVLGLISLRCLMGHVHGVNLSYQSRREDMQK